MEKQWQPRGILNFRDVGKAVGGNVGPKPGRLYRSSILENATKDDRQNLHNDLSITTIVNLDGPPLHKKQATDGSGTLVEAYKDDIHTYHVLDITVHDIRMNSQAYARKITKELPWQTTAVGAFWLMVDNPKKSQKGVLRDMSQIMRSRFTWGDFLEFSQLQIKTVFQALAEPDLGPVLVCGNGAALIICLVLKLLGVDDKDVKREHNMTEQFHQALMDQQNEKRRKLDLEDLAPVDFPATDPDRLTDLLDSEHKGVENYLAKIGVTGDEMSRISANMRGGGGLSEKLVDL